MHKILLNRSVYLLFLFVICNIKNINAQLSYGSVASFGVNKLNPSYTGNALQIRRACDNATVNIGFNSCGDLDTIALNNFAGLQNFPLGSLTSSATAAYSLRKVNCAYTGFAITIRSSAAGNPTTNIGFTINGDLDTAAIKSFVGSNSAYVTVWYDQSGNGKNVSQASTANQPMIVNAGVISRQNGRPAVTFLSASSTNLYLNTLMVSDKITVSIIAKINNAAARNTLFDLGSIPSGFPDFAIEANTFSTGGNKWGFYANNNSLDGTVATSTNLTCLSLTAQNTYTASANLIANTNLYVNGTASPLSCRSCVTSVYRSAWPNGFVIGNFNGAYVSYLNGFISEFIIFPSALSTTERQFLEWTQSQYYGITPANALGTLPAGVLPSAFVLTWYDQSGNGKNITKNTELLQPRIVNRGVVEKQNSIPAVYFNGTSSNLSTSDAGLPTADMAISAVVKANLSSYASGNYGSFLHYGSSGTGNSIFATFGTDGNMGTNSICISQYGDAVGIANSLNANLIYSTRRIGSNYVVYKNGGSLASKTMASNTTLYGANGLSIGANNASLPGSYLNGYISQVSLFPSGFLNTRRILLESSQAAYYTIAISNNKYTPPTTATYNRFVNGIGRESATDTVLGTRSTVGMGIKSGTVAGTDFLQSDGDYIMYGINCPVGPQTVTTNIPATVTHRWANDWYVNKTDVGTTGGNLKIYYDFADYGYSGSPGLATNYELLYRNSSAGTFAIVSRTTKSVVSSRVEFDVNATAIANGYYTIGTKNASASPLPIELLYFNAIANKNHVNLSWATATETSNNYFTIEKSKDGIDFKPLKTVKSKAVNGNSLSQLNYYDIDEDPYSGISYYRLMQTDFDGAYKRSTIVDVNFDGSDVTDISVYPNPNQGQFTLSFNGFNSLQINAGITIMDALGKKVYENNVILSDGSLSYQIIPTEKIAKGFYVLNCVIDGTNYTHKILVN